MSDTNSSSSRRPSLMSEHGPENQFISVENPVIALCSKAKFDWDSNLHLQLIPESNLDLNSLNEENIIEHLSPKCPPSC